MFLASFDVDRGNALMVFLYLAMMVKFAGGRPE